MNRKLSRRSLLTAVPVVMLAGCSPVTFAPSTPQPQPEETPDTVPSQPETPPPTATPISAPSPTPAPDPTPTPEPIEQVVRIAGTLLDRAHSDSTSLPECLVNAFTRAGLTVADAEFRIQPGWATAWEQLEDRDGWRFLIQENSDGWKDGVPVTARDFRDAWLDLLGRERSSPEASILFDVENAVEFALGAASSDAVGIGVIDDWTLEVYLDRPRETFPAVASSPLLWPKPPDDVGADGSACLLNGPFEIASQDEDLIALIPDGRNPSQSSTLIERVELTALSSGQAMTEFRLDSLGLMHLSGTTFNQVRDDNTLNDRLFQGAPTRIIMLVPNLEFPPFDLVEVRRALSLMIDRSRLEQIVQGRVMPAETVFPPGMFPELDAALAGTGAVFDVDAAYEALETTPYIDPGLWPEFGLDVPAGDGYLDRVARDVATQLRENLGVQVPIRIHDPAEYAEGLRERRYPLAWLEWTYPYADPASVYADLFASWSNPTNPISWSDPEYDELVRVADTLDTAEARASVYSGCESLLHERGACIPLVHPVEFYLVQPWLNGLPLDSRGRIITGEAFGVNALANVEVVERLE